MAVSTLVVLQLGVLLLLSLLTETVAARGKPRPAHLHTPTTTFVSVKVLGECTFVLHEVRPTTSHHMTEFEPVVHPQPHDLQQHGIHPKKFGTAAYTKEFFSHRIHVSYIDPTTKLEMCHVQPDPRIIYLDTHGEGPESYTPHDHHDTHDHHDHDHTHHHDHDHDGAAAAHMSPEGYILLWIPSNVPDLTISCHNMSSRMAIAMPMAPAPAGGGGSGTSSMMMHHEPMRKHFFTLDDSDDGIQFTQLRSTAPPDRVNSIVFLSDGYLASDNETFFNRVNQIVNAIDDSTTTDNGLKMMKGTVPLTRYLPFWNVYAIFQPSPEAGASRPLYGKTVNDNLGCYHTPQLERAIQCDRSKAMSLARVAPVPEDPDVFLIVVVVNTNIYGGTGLFQQGTIHIGHFFGGWQETNGNLVEMPIGTYASLVNHECGHAYGQLLDEYAIGRSATPPYFDWSNCLMPGDSGGYKTPVPWQFWIDIFNGNNVTAQQWYMGSEAALLGSQGYGTRQIPEAVCGYYNYYKGSDRCMMNRLSDSFMCPQCREGYSKALFATEFEVQWPRRPLEDQVLILSRHSSTYQGIPAGGATLHLPAQLRSENHFRVEWLDQNNNSVSSPPDSQCPVCLFIDADTLSTWPLDTVVTYAAIIYDESIFIQPSERSQYPFMTQRANFRMIIPSVDPASGGATTPTPSTTEPASTTTAAPPANESTTTVPPILAAPENYNANITVAVATPLADSRIGKYTSSTPAGVVDAKGFMYQCIPVTAGSNGTCELVNGTQQKYTYSGNIDSLAQYDEYVLYVLAAVAVILILLWVYASVRYKKVAGRVVRPIFKTEFSTIVTLIRRIMMVSSILFMVGAVSALAASGYFYTKTSFVGKVVIIGGVFVSLNLYLMAFVGFWAISNRAKKMVMANGVIMIIAEVLLIAALAMTNVVCEEILANFPLGDYQGELTAWWLSNTASDPNYICGWQSELSCSGWGNFSCSGSFVDPAYCPPPESCTSNAYGISCQVQINEIVDQWYPVVFAVLVVCVVLMAGAVVFNYIYYFSLWRMKKQFRARNNERVYKATAKRGISRADVDKAKALHVLRTLDVGDIQHLVKEFRRIDGDGNGTLDMKELGIFFRKALCYKISIEELKQIFMAMDLDGDGTISVDEFLAVFRPEEIAGLNQQPGAPMLNYPAGEVPLVAGSSLDRQRRVRERLESTFQSSGAFDGSPKVAQVQHVAFTPQAINPADYGMPHHHGAPPQFQHYNSPPQGQQMQHFASPHQGMQQQYSPPPHHGHQFSRTDSL